MNNASIFKNIPIIFLIVYSYMLFIDVDISFAQNVDTGFIYEISKKFDNQAKKYLEIFTRLSLSIFRVFLLISVALTGVRAALGRTDIAEVLKEFILLVLFAAFCYVAIIKYDVWTRFLLNLERNVAVNHLGLHYLSLEPINTGFQIWGLVLGNFGLFDFLTGKTLAVFFIGLFNLCILAVMTARLLVVVCESYLVMSIGVILLGFGSASFARDYAISAMKYVVSLVLKILAMHVVLAIGLEFIKDMVPPPGADAPPDGWATQLAILMVVSCILYIIQNTLAEAVAGLVNGAHIGSGVGMASAVGAAGSTVTRTASVVGAPVLAAGAMAAGVGAVSKAAKIASLEGHGGVQGTAKVLWNSYQEARQDEKRAGVAPNSAGESRRMSASINDMHAAKDPQQGVNPFSRGRGGNELANQQAMDQRQNASQQNTGASVGQDSSQSGAQGAGQTKPKAPKAPKK